MSEMSLMDAIFPTDDTKDFPYTADDVILNLILPISMAGSLTLEAIQSFKKESIEKKCNLLLEVITLQAGSSTDGLSIPEITHMNKATQITEGSDTDALFVFTSLIVDSENKRAFASMDSSGSPPGYTKLYFNSSWLEKRPSKCGRERREEQYMMKHFPSFLNSDNTGEIHRKKLVSLLRKYHKESIQSTKHALEFLNLYDTSTVSQLSISYNGPAVTINRTVSGVSSSLDNVVALPCPRWPKEANEWVRRPRVWPSKRLVQHIVRTGCHIVPKGSSQVDDVTNFIISFSYCEKLLGLNLSIPQKRCYILFKYLVKYSMSKGKCGLTSYHCKTILYRRCEVIPKESWTRSNPLQCVMWLMADLKAYVDSGHLPHYFIPEMNMIEKINQVARAVILEDICRIQESMIGTFIRLTESERFCWLSKDLSLRQCLKPLLYFGENDSLKKAAQESVVDFLCNLLDKGETTVALSIICESEICEIQPPVDQMIAGLSKVINSEPGTDNVCLKALLAVLLHQKAAQYEKDNEISEKAVGNIKRETNKNEAGETTESTARQTEIAKQLLSRSKQMFENVIADVGTHIWIIAEYYNLLCKEENYEQLIKHFSSLIRFGCKRETDIDLFEGGIYTCISEHNYRTVDAHISDIGDFIVPSMVFIVYKAILATSVLVGFPENVKYRSNCVRFSKKIMSKLEVWYKNKHRLFPEIMDENIQLLLGICFKIMGLDEKFLYHFQEAKHFRLPDDDILKEHYWTDHIDKLCSSKSIVKKGRRHHPYARHGKVREFSFSSLDGRIKDFRLKPFVHY